MFVFLFILLAMVLSVLNLTISVCPFGIFEFLFSPNSSSYDFPHFDITTEQIMLEYFNKNTQFTNENILTNHCNLGAPNTERHLKRWLEQSLSSKS